MGLVPEEEEEKHVRCRGETAAARPTLPRQLHRRGQELVHEVLAMDGH